MDSGVDDWESPMACFVAVTDRQQEIVDIASEWVEAEEGGLEVALARTCVVQNPANLLTKLG